MKKILLIILVSFCLKAESQVNTRLDTVFTRYLVFTYEEISYVKGGWKPADSSQKAFFKKMAAAVNAVSNKVNATNITVDSIPGPVAVLWYSSFRNSAEGETAGFTNNIKSKIKGYGPLTTTCQNIDNGLDARRTAITKSGKEDW